MEESAPVKKLMIASNWKCNGTLNSVKDFINNHLNKLEFDTNKLEVMVAPVSIHIAGVKALSKDHVQVGC